MKTVVSAVALLHGNRPRFLTLYCPNPADSA
jgi:hypothetical protein